MSHFPLIAAPPTAFHADGSLHLGAVELQAERLVADGVDGVFVCGTTGEASSMTTAERMALATRWSEVLRGSPMQLLVHVGTNCVEDAKSLARHASTLGAGGFAAVAPCYFKPADIRALLDVMAAIAGAAPELPFYYYEIPSLTGIHLPSDRFLEAALGHIPNMAGLKFSNNDLVMLQRCAAVAPGRLEIRMGSDELLLAALQYGATGAVGSTYNVATPLFQTLIDSAKAGDIAAARAAQLASVRLIDTLAKRGYLPSLKALLTARGIPMGPVRLPLRNLDAVSTSELLGELDLFGFR
jgi:N-acetylneuraminate lyase